MKILITGHQGLIGRKIYDRLKLFHDVIGLDKKEFIDYLKWSDGNVDMIIHCGANCVIREIIEKPDLAMENIDSTYLIMEYARLHNIKKVVLFSSSRLEHNNMNPYIVSKRFVENMAEAYHECYGLDYMLIRPETVWGLNDNFVRVIPRWIKQALNDKPITVYGDKYKFLSPIHVEDFTNTFLNCVDDWDIHKNTVVKIAGKPLRTEKIIRIIKKVTGSKSKVKYGDAELSQPQEPVVDDYHYYSDGQRFEERLKEMLNVGK